MDTSMGAPRPEQPPLPARPSTTMRGDAKEFIPSGKPLRPPFVFSVADINMPSEEAPSTIERSLMGATVLFGEGAQVLGVRLPSDQTPPVPAEASAGLPACTVYCEWNNPSRIVLLRYRSNKWAKYAVNRFEKRLRGRSIQCQIEPPVDLKNGSWVVELRNVSSETTREEITARLQRIPPDEVVFGIPTSTQSREESVETVKRLLQQSGRTLEAFDLEVSPTGSTFRAFARFRRPSDVSSILALSKSQIGAELGAALNVYHIIAISLQLLPELYLVIRDEIQELQSSAPKGAALALIQHNAFQPVIVRIYGESPKRVAQLKREVERLLEGQVLLHDTDAALWSVYWATQAGASFCHNLGVPGKLFLYRDVRNLQLVVYGEKHRFDGVCRAIQERIFHSPLLPRVISLDAEEFLKVITGGLRRLINEFGKDRVRFDLLQFPVTIFLKGKPEDDEPARQLLFNTQVTDADIERLEGRPDCPACLMEPEHPVTLTCGHSYCWTCLRDQCHRPHHNSENKAIMCVGRNGTCFQPIALEVLKEILPSEDFEDLLRGSFDGYTRWNSDDIRSCLTPNCVGVYRRSNHASLHTCPSCMTTICTACETLGHEGLTCQEAKDVESLRDLLKASKSENDIRDCPKCTTSLEKVNLCNHVICIRCKIHICWLCMAIFPDGAPCSDHIHREHDGTAYRDVDALAEDGNSCAEEHVESTEEQN